MAQNLIFFLIAQNSIKITRYVCRQNLYEMSATSDIDMFVVS